MPLALRTLALLLSLALSSASQRLASRSVAGLPVDELRALRTTFESLVIAVLAASATTEAASLEYRHR